MTRNKIQTGEGEILFLTLATSDGRRSWVVLAFQLYYMFQLFHHFEKLSISKSFHFFQFLRNIIGSCKDAALLKKLVETLGFQHMDLEVTAPRVSWITGLSLAMTPLAPGHTKNEDLTTFIDPNE